MKRNIQFLILLFFVCSLLFFSCKKFVEIPPPKNQLVASAVFTDSANATAAVVGLYISMVQNFELGFASGGITVYSGLCADELKLSSSNNTDELDFYNNSISPNNSINGNLWIKAYNLIYATNACIQGLSETTSISKSAKNQLLGEAKFVRAFIYFNLINLYGAIPLITTTDYRENQVLPRASEEATYSQIILDLKDAQTLLMTNYVTNDRIRPNLYTALFLLSKVYLYQKNWVESESAATEVINSGLYTLESDLNNVFLATSDEAIWKISPVIPGLETWEGYFLVPGNSSAPPSYIITNTLLDGFTGTDQRVLYWINANTINGQQYYYPYKYKLGYDGEPSPKENLIVFRLAEEYLIRAEARAQQDNISDALADLNVVRTRAGIPGVAVTNQSDLLSSIQHERQLELFSEWGNRWFDLKRTYTVNSVMSALKPNWQPTDTLFPIPQTEINSNPFLTQNPGY